MRPFSVKNKEFKHMLNVLKQWSEIPSHSHFSKKIVLDLHEQEKTTSSVALTKDSWTSGAMKSYVTITEHFTTAEWKIRSPLLQTRPLYDTQAQI